MDGSIVQSNRIISLHSVRSIFLARGEVGGITGDYTALNARHVMHTVTAHRFYIHTYILIYIAQNRRTNLRRYLVDGRGWNPHRSLWRHNSETIRDREKRRPPHPMKSYELSNGETASLYNNFCKTGNYVIYDVIIWVQDGNCKKWLERILVLVRSTI